MLLTTIRLATNQLHDISTRPTQIFGNRLLNTQNFCQGLLNLNKEFGTYSTTFTVDRFAPSRESNSNGGKTDILQHRVPAPGFDCNTNVEILSMGTPQKIMRNANKAILKPWHEEESIDQKIPTLLSNWQKLNKLLWQGMARIIFAKPKNIERKYLTEELLMVQHLGI